MCVTLGLLLLLTDRRFAVVAPYVGGNLSAFSGTGSVAWSKSQEAFESDEVGGVCMFGGGGGGVYISNTAVYASLPAM